MNRPVNSCFGIDMLSCMNKLRMLNKLWNCTAPVSDMDSLARWFCTCTSFKSVIESIASHCRQDGWIFLGMYVYSINGNICCWPILVCLHQNLTTLLESWRARKPCEDFKHTDAFIGFTHVMNTLTSLLHQMPEKEIKMRKEVHESLMNFVSTIDANYQPRGK